MNIIVTGGAGFIGSNFLNLFAPQNPEHNFINIDKLGYAANLQNLENIENLPNYSFIQTDITDSSPVNELIEKFNPGLVVHFAAESHVDRSILGPAEFIQSNIIGTFNLLEACRKHWSQETNNTPAPPNSLFDTRLQDHLETPSPLRGEGRGGGEKLFLHVSTDEVYGSLGATGFFTETTAYDPSSPYSASKASADHLVKAYHRTYGLPAIIANCSNNYGPYQFPEKLIPLMIINALENKPLPVYGKGENVRDWLYVEDHCRALWTLALQGKPGESYNIGGNNECKNIDLIHTLCATLAAETGKPAAHYLQLIEFVADRPGHDLRYAIDSTKIKNTLGWQPIETFETGLQKTIKWYLANPGWIKNIQTGAYQAWLNTNYRGRSS